MATKTEPEQGYRWVGGYRHGAAYLGCSERQLRRWVQQGRVEHTRMGLAVLFTREQLDAFVARSTYEVAS